MNVRERAVYYLNLKPCTKQQLIKYLEKKEYDHNEINEVVTELEEYNFINDENFCRLYFERGFEKGHGVNRIKRELSQKGVSSHIIEEVYNELEDIPDPLEIALEIGRGIVSRIDLDELDYDEKRKLQAKIGRRIISRGFSSDIAYKVMAILVK